MSRFLHTPSSSSSLTLYFNKYILVELHNAAKHEFRALRSTAAALGSHSLTNALDTPLATRNLFRTYPDISHLRPISVFELQVETVHTGRVLYGTLCVEPFRVHGVWSVLETDDPESAVRVTIYDSDPEWKAKYRPGKRIAIKEPYFRFSRGTLFIRIDNMHSILEVPPSAPTAAERSLPEEVKEVIRLKEEGNRYFGMKEWNRAILAYSRCIAEAKELEEVDRLPEESVLKMRMELLVPAYSNRAEVYLKIGGYEMALADSNCALEVNPMHVKSMFRKGRALDGLHEYEQALTWLKTAVNNGAPVEDVEPALRSAELCNEQSKTGKFPGLKEFLLGHGPPPTCSDFVGPVKIQKVNNPGRQAGVGLFATRNLRAGELLIVSNALGYIGADTPTVHLFEQVKGKMSKSGRAAGQLKVLLEIFIPVNGNVDMFRANCGVVPEDLKEASAAISEDYVVAVCDRSLRMPFDLRSRDFTGVWVLPAVMRHSCLFNTSIIQVGAAAFVHAARDVKAGEELTTGYCDTLVPYEGRRRRLESFGLTCDCQRCKLEKPLKKQLAKLLQASAADCVKTLEKKLKAMKRNLNSDKECWIRASYAYAHLASYRNVELLLSSSKELMSALDVVTTIHKTVPGHYISRILTFHWLINHHESFSEQLELHTELVQSLHRSFFGNEDVNVEEALKIWNKYMFMDD